MIYDEIRAFLQNEIIFTRLGPLHGIIAFFFPFSSYDGMITMRIMTSLARQLWRVLTNETKWRDPAQKLWRDEHFYEIRAFFLLNYDDYGEGKKERTYSLLS